MGKTRPPVLQVLFEPWPDPEGEEPFRRGDGDPEVFAGTYWFDALDADGNLKDRGFRATFSGCTLCRRADDNPRAHWPTVNDQPPGFGLKRKRLCGTWKDIERVVKAFGGWKWTHYVELPAWEGLEYQPIPQRRRTPCDERTCHQGLMLDASFNRVVCVTCRGTGFVAHEGPIRPDRFALSAEQRRMRR